MLALSPLLVPLATALLCVLTQAQPRWQQRLSLAGALVLLGCALALLQQVLQSGTVNVAAGNWPLPYGIEFAVDRLSAALVLIAALMVTVTIVWPMNGLAPHATTTSSGLVSRPRVRFIESAIAVRSSGMPGLGV